MGSHRRRHSRWDIRPNIPLGIRHAISAPIRNGTTSQNSGTVQPRVGDIDALHEGAVLEAIDVVRVAEGASELGGGVGAGGELDAAAAVGGGLEAEVGIVYGSDGAVDAYAPGEEGLGGDVWG